MGKIKIPYYVVVKGRGYWRPHPRMRLFGFQCVPCGPDGPGAWQVASTWNNRWQAFRRGEKAAPLDVSDLPREAAEVVRRYPLNSVGAGFQRYIRTEEWNKKAHSTRTKIWWPCWFRIRAIWGDVNPNTITFEQMSAWRAKLEQVHSRDVAHKTFKVWRALWNVLRAQKIANCADPSLAVVNSAPRPRHQSWQEPEVVLLVKGAWRRGFHGLACCIAVAWDTQFSPVDVRTLTPRHLVRHRKRMFFDRQEDGRTKTGKAAIGTLSRRSERLIEAYLANWGAEALPDAPLFRNRSGDEYSEFTLADDFREIRAAIFPGETRRLMDMRRSGTREAVAGGANPLGLAAKMANSIDRSNTLHRTYSPVDLQTVLAVDEARKIGRRRMRDGNE